MRVNLDSWVAKITGIFQSFGAVLLAAIVFVVFVGIISRYSSTYGIMGLDEVGAILGVCMVFFGIAYALREEKHIGIEVLTSLLDAHMKAKAISEMFNYVVMIIICCLMIWQCFRLAIFSYVQQFKSYIFGFPLYIMRIVVLVGMISFLVEVFCQIAHLVRRNKNVKGDI